MNTVDTSTLGHSFCMASPEKIRPMRSVGYTLTPAQADLTRLVDITRPLIQAVEQGFVG